MHTFKILVFRYPLNYAEGLFCSKSVQNELLKDDLCKEENLMYLDGVICNLTVMWILTVPDLGVSVGYLSAAVAPFYLNSRNCLINKKTPPKPPNKTPLLTA